MTGYGRYELQKSTCRFTIELKGVNHRYLDLNVRLPRVLNQFETKIRNLVKKRLTRGKVDLFVNYENLAENAQSLKYNEALAKEYLNLLKQMSTAFSLENDIRVSHLSRYPEIFSMEEQEVDDAALWSGLKEAVEKALEKFIETKEREGAHLKENVLEKLDRMELVVKDVALRSPEIIAAYRDKLEAKIKEVLADHQLDENRIASEVVLFADKICTDEETVRLRSHMEQMRETLKEDGIGRKLDFIAQEMNREANTILSKCNDIEVSGLGIHLKTGVEQIREQIQNIE